MKVLERKTAKGLPQEAEGETGRWLQTGWPDCLPWQEANFKRKNGRNNSEVIYRTHVFPHRVNAITAANRGGVMTAYIVGQTDARLPHRGVFVFETSLI
jgi:hypothetical protein